MPKYGRTVTVIVLLILVSVFLLFSGAVFAQGNETVRFSDVPYGHWADKAVHELRLLGITDGVGGNKFGMGLTIKRSEFVAFLVRLMKWEPVKPENGSFSDNMDPTKWYYAPIETAVKYGVVSNDAGRFRTDDPITREEMAVMIVRALGYDTLAKQLTYLGSPFDDVSANTGYITIAKDFGIITGVGGNLFKPYDTAKREEAAVMMMRMYERLNGPINELHAFYAIRSAEQANMIGSLDSVSFGWSRLEYDAEMNKVVLNTTRANDNEYAFPASFSEPLNLARRNNIPALLGVFVKSDMVFSNENKSNLPLVQYIIANPDIRKQVVRSIAEQVSATTKDSAAVSFNGAVIDFETLKGEFSKQCFNEFLYELRQELDKENKLLYVAVHPKRRPGQSYYDGYDYKTIGKIADKIILMAHDYYARQLTDAEMQSGYTVTPLSPIDEVYYALRSIADKDTGVEDLSKVWLQISFDSVQWKLKGGKVINRYPYNPSYEAIGERLAANDTAMHYSELSQNPYATFHDGSDQTDNVLWYEDSRSVSAKIKLAKMFGIKGISLWRLGNIPDYEENSSKRVYLDTWQEILHAIGK